MLLVIDSATAACSAALIGPDGALIDERHEIVGRGHAERLVPMIADLLAGRRPAAILVDCGPGSFTGVRVGLAAAHGLAIGWKVPLAGFSSLALLAAASGEAEVAVALSGGHGELFVQSYGGDPLAPLDDLRSLAPAGRGRSGQRRAGRRLGRRGAGGGARSGRWRGCSAPRRRRPAAARAASLPCPPVRSTAARPMRGR